jgi:hypothetical protein
MTGRPGARKRPSHLADIAALACLARAVGFARTVARIVPQRRVLRTSSVGSRAIARGIQPGGQCVAFDPIAGTAGI